MQTHPALLSPRASWVRPSPGREPVERTLRGFQRLPVSLLFLHIIIIIVIITILIVISLLFKLLKKEEEEKRRKGRKAREGRQEQERRVWEREEGTGEILCIEHSRRASTGQDILI